MLQTLITTDQQVFAYLHTWEQWNPSIWRIIAIWGVYLIPILLVWYWFTRRRDTALLAFIGGIVGWQGMNNLITSFIDRARPADYYQLNVSLTEGFLHRPGSSFPSDHTAFITGVGLIFWFAGERRIALVVFGLELLTIVGRIVVGFHWLGDILAGVVVGLVSAGLVWSARRPLDQWIVTPVIGFAKRLGL